MTSWPSFPGAGVGVGAVFVQGGKELEIGSSAFLVPLFGGDFEMVA